MKNALDYAIKTSKEQGIDIGIELGKIADIQHMLAKRYSWEKITEITELTQPAYESLRTKHNR